MLGFLPPSSSATFLTVRGGGGHDPPARREAAGERHQVDPGVLGERCTGARAGAEHEVADPGRQPGLVEQAHQVYGGVGRQLAGLEHERVAGREAGRDLPGDLEQRVVPGRDQAAHADRLVHDPADDVGCAGVDHPAGLLGGDAAVVAEDARPRRRCRTRSRPGACRCPGTPSGRGRPRRARAGRRRGAAGRPARGRTWSARGPRGRPRGRRRWLPGCPRRRPRRPSRPGRRRPGSGSPGAAPARAGTHRPPTKSSATGAHPSRNPGRCVCRNPVLDSQRVLEMRMLRAPVAVKDYSGVVT